MECVKLLPKDIKKLISQYVFRLSSDGTRDEVLGEFTDKELDEMTLVEKKFLINLLKDENISGLGKLDKDFYSDNE